MLALSMRNQAKLVGGNCNKKQSVALSEPPLPTTSTEPSDISVKVRRILPSPQVFEVGNAESFCCLHLRQRVRQAV